MLQSCPTLCNPMDCSPRGSSVPGILQARILGWVAMPSSKGSSRPRDWTHVSCSPTLRMDSLPTEPPGKSTYVNSCWCMGKKVRTFWNFFSFFSVVHWIHECRTYQYWRMTLIVVFSLCDIKPRLQTVLCLKKAQEGTIGCTLTEQNFPGPCCIWHNQTSWNIHMVHPEPKSVLLSSLGMRRYRMYRIFIEIFIFLEGSGHPPVVREAHWLTYLSHPHQTMSAEGFSDQTCVK